MGSFSALFAASLAASAAAFTSPANPLYTEICPKLADGKAHEVNPGYFVKYQCGQLGPNDGTTVGANSPSECASACQEAVSKCTGSSWSSARSLCYLSGSQQGRPAPGYIYMKRVPYEQVIKYCRGHPEEKDCYAIV